jgi:uncharacterized protein YdaU (DUF1376 family)
MSNPWTPFYWADYVSDTGHLSLQQHGAYLLLMAHYYRTKRPIPANVEQVHRICRCTTDADKHATEEVLREFFILEGNAYRHHRIDDELAKAVDISGKRRAAAKARHQQSRANAPAKPEASASASAVQMHPQSQSQSQSQLQLSLQKDTTTGAWPGAEALMPPKWIPADAWNGFVEMRKKTKAPLTHRAITLIIKELEKLRVDGHEPGAVLDQSTRNNWKDVYPLKGNSGNEKHRNGNRAERRQAENIAAGEQALEILQRRMAN